MFAISRRDFWQSSLSSGSGWSGCSRGLLMFLAARSSSEGMIPCSSISDRNKFQVQQLRSGNHSRKCYLLDQHRITGLVTWKPARDQCVLSSTADQDVVGRTGHPVVQPFCGGQSVLFKRLDRRIAKQRNDVARVGDLCQRSCQQLSMLGDRGQVQSQIDHSSLPLTSSLERDSNDRTNEPRPISSEIRPRFSANA